MKQPNRLRVLSYNIHKGFSAANREFVLAGIKRSIQETGADLVLLQEVLGHHERHASRVADWPTQSQFEYLADSTWSHFAYGKNAVYDEGHHGNAILSRYPISFWENEDVSPNRIERRGLLHAAVEIPGISEPIHVVCVHLALFESDRRDQLDAICKRLDRMAPPGSPIVVGGDFNDWRENASAPLERALGLREAFIDRTGRHARTFPSWLPVLKLDRLYFRGLRCETASLMTEARWKNLSDHLPIVADFELDVRKQRVD
jgi:endonuclease/exonuclease/phosphatase family metal-dependent hydrolase